MKWAKATLAGTSNTPSAAGDSITVTIRAQHWFRANEITFTPATNGDTIESIVFGDRLVWNNASGVPVGVSSSVGMLRGLLSGNKIRPDLDIIIKGSSGSTAALSAVLIGHKPASARC